MKIFGNKFFAKNTNSKRNKNYLRQTSSFNFKVLLLKSKFLLKLKED